MKTKDGLWRLSPSSLYTYTECTSCFWVDNHFKRPPMLPLLLNSAMDSILKYRYDKYRADNTFPPEAQKLHDLGIKPFLDVNKLNTWREKLDSLSVTDVKTGYMLVGKIDDVFVEADGRLVPADYKSSGNAPTDDKQKYYRDQLAAYGFMFAKNGHRVSDRAYLLHYYVKDKADPSIDVKFDFHLDRVEINIESLERKLNDMVDVLNKPYPGNNQGCEKCRYYQGRSEHTHTTISEHPTLF
jgi:hypothetical protein